MQSDKLVLVVDDEPGFTEGLVANLKREGYRAAVAHDGQQALQLFADRPVDMVLLDVMLPGLNGREVCKQIRSRSTVPIIMLTARDDDIDKILGLEVGADDYLTKPFNFRELLARMNAVMRRVNGTQSASDRQSSVLPVTTGVRLDTDRRALIAAGEEHLPLTVKEFSLMELFGRNPARVFSRDELLDRVWGYDYYGSPRTVDVHIRRLRKKLEQLRAVEDGSEIIKTSWGAGYFMERPDEET